METEEIIQELYRPYTKGGDVGVIPDLYGQLEPNAEYNNEPVLLFPAYYGDAQGGPPCWRWAPMPRPAAGTMGGAPCMRRRAITGAADRMQVRIMKKIAVLLLEAGASALRKDENGWPPAHCAGRTPAPAY